MFNKLKDIYSGKKVFLTGHTGFKGAWFLNILSLLGANVKGYALAPEGDTDLYNVINGDSLCQSVIADIRDKGALNEAITSFNPDFVFHFAAQPLVRLSYKIPSETFEVNAVGTANLLDAIRLIDNPCYSVLITTDKVYHNNEWEYPYRESDRLGGYDPYSASKACAELVIDSFRNSFFNINEFNKHKKAIAVARAGNVIGGGDWAKDRLIPDIIKALSNNKPVEIRNPSAVRPWQHVLEPLVGYLTLGAKLFGNPQKFSQPYNFGPNSNDTLPVREMVSLAINNWGGGEYFINRDGSNPHEAGLLKLDINKAASELGWYPKLKANDAVQLTIDWYRNYFENPSNIGSYTMEQIQHFFHG